MKALRIIVLAALAAGAAVTIGWQFSLGRKLVAIVAPHPADLTRPRPPAAASGSQPGPAAGTKPGPAGSEAKLDEAGQALAAALDVFTSPQSSFYQKQEVLEQLRKGGHLEEAIATLKQLAAQNPNDLAIPTALGEAQISEIRTLYENGASPLSNDVAILGLEADKNFSVALALDPTNWDAQFEKAASMAHWPPMMNKGPEVVQRLTDLVAQQEAATTPRPEYAATYAVLGDQYQAAGQADKAAQIWQEGLGHFPLNPTLQRKLSPVAAP
jgi:tetratricopeptide (TPR) repeat protein